MDKTGTRHRACPHFGRSVRTSRRRRDRLRADDPVGGRAGDVSPGAGNAPGLNLYALDAADGTPIMVTDSREAVLANAWSHELETVVSVH